ncbi:hypothetical protein HPG69_009296 [Diceros bicornis minor]|uniref:Uncharacterized protein n=1 Tax=Diceros bicornis minor TaxID=77932 RepID=A0A7J7FIR0_DICBM|nr:hypothetical protein HPG69_009296 [Diceros bicornis minor]
MAWGFLTAFLAQAGVAPLVIFPSLPPTTAELHLEGNFLHRLPSEVSALQHLKAIDLSRNQFHDFPEQLTTLPALETINLEENEIVGEWTQPVGPLPPSAVPPSELPFLSETHRAQGMGLWSQTGTDTRARMA